MDICPLNENCHDAGDSVNCEWNEGRPMAEQVQGTQSFSRSMDVLQMIADADGALSRAELVSASGLTRPTVYRIIAALEAERLIEATRDNRYRLGGRLIALARKALSQNDVRRVAEPELARLRDATGETVHLAIRSGDELVYIDKIESLAAVRMTSTIGTRIRFHASGVGKAYLSGMSADDANALINRLELTRITEFTTTDRGQLQRIVDAARREGFVRDDQENEIGIVCFGAPVLEAAGQPVASVSVSVPLYRLEEAEKYTRPLVRAVAEISRNLGYIAP